jgi:hypothetical protein
MAAAQPLAREKAMPDFTWGDSVRVKAGAPAAMRPGALAAVCAMTEIENDAQAKEYEAPIGSTVYLIEFGDGTSIEIPEAWIEAGSPTKP